jgi:hypothetical protein
MGRKRLMTVLAGVIAAVGLHVGPAAALDLGLPGIGDATVETSDGLSVEADLDAGVDSVIKLTPKVEAELSSEPTLKVEDGATVGDTEIDLGEATEPVQDAVNETKQPSPAPVPSPDAPADGGEGGASDQPKGDTAAEDGASSSDGEVTTAGRSQAAMSPERAARLDALRAIRDQDAALGGVAFDGNVLPGVELAPRSSALDDFAADPEVAPGVEVAAPSVAGDQPQSAQLATTPFSGVLPEIPIALQLLAGTLVAGTALAWHLARKELSAAPVVRTSGRR